jgi:hypothetical protein
MFIVVLYFNGILLYLDYKKECSSKGMNREKGKVEIKREKQLN